MLPSLTGLAFHNKSANVEADSSGVLDLQEIFNLVIEQILNNNSANTLCQSLQSWCTAQRLACTPEVYTAACTVFGIDDEEKCDYLRTKLVQTLSEYPEELPPLSVNNPWKTCFKTICVIYTADTENRLGPIVQNRVNAPFYLVQQAIEAEQTKLPYWLGLGLGLEGAKLLKARGRKFVVMAALGENREELKRVWMNKTYNIFTTTLNFTAAAPYNLENAFTQANILLDPSIFVQTTDPNDASVVQPKYKRLDFLLLFRMGDRDVIDSTVTERWARWLLSLGPDTYTPNARNEKGLTAIEYLTYMQRDNNPTADRSGAFVVMLKHRDAFSHAGPEKNTLLHILFEELVRIFPNMLSRWTLKRLITNIREATERIFAATQLYHERHFPADDGVCEPYEMFEKVFFTRNAVGELPFEKFEKMMALIDKFPFNDELFIAAEKGRIIDCFKRAEGPSGASEEGV